MTDDKMRVIVENVARTMDRRQFVRRLGGTIFGGMAALAAGQLLGPGTAKASNKWSKSDLIPGVPLAPNCSPPGPYCNLNGVNEPNGCHGSSCFQHLSSGQVLQCVVYYQYYAQTGCWTHVNTSGSGYWTCCDCACGPTGSVHCGCAQLSYGGVSAAPTPRPDGQDSGAQDSSK